MTALADRVTAPVAAPQNPHASWVPLMTNYLAVEQLSHSNLLEKLKPIYKQGLAIVRFESRLVPIFLTEHVRVFAKSV